MTFFAGVDVGAREYDCVLADERGTPVERATLRGPAEAAAFAAAAEVVAIDAPQALSSAPHGDDLTLAPKFRSARCAEISLGREHGFWVPWPAPASDPPPWMLAGFELFTVLPGAVEVYPYAGFVRLAGVRLPKKQTRQGRALRAAICGLPGATGWTHHQLDALLAARIARDRALGSATAAGCGHDGSAIWLPG